MTTANFQSWANSAGVPWRAIKPHLDDVVEKARSLWPDALRELPMDKAHKKKLREHWSGLQKDFKVDSEG